MMKSLSAFLLLFTLATASAQPRPPVPALPPRTQSYAPESAPEVPGLTRFDLNFPGGTPGELVTAIQKATHRPLNAIIPDDYAKTRLPALKMSNVDVAQLFQALGAASRKTEIVTTGSYYGGGAYGGYSSQQSINTGYGFRCEGKVNDDTVWFFYVEKPNYPGNLSARVCRFYALAPLLERGTTVNEITKAIETGTKMLGETSGPEITFQKETKLLIAVGEPNKLEIIDAVLRALEPPKPGAPEPKSAKPGEKPKAEKP